MSGAPVSVHTGRGSGVPIVRWLNPQATQGVDRLGGGEQEIEQPHCTQAVTVVLTRAAPNRCSRCSQFQVNRLYRRPLPSGRNQYLCFPRQQLDLQPPLSIQGGGASPLLDRQ